MIEDLRKSRATRLDADVCIVGAGAAGIALALELSRSGRSVALLETGGDRYDADAQDLSTGEAVGVQYLGLEFGRYRGLGGATRRWAGQCMPFDPIDFEAREWVPHSGWPISLESLAPYYARAERFFGLTGTEVYDERNYERFGIVPAPFAHDRLRSRFTIFGRTPDIIRTHRRELARSKNVRVYLNAHVTKLHLDAAGEAVDRLEIGRRDRQTLVMHARTVVLCAGGIESARLLLLSNDEQPAGIGNAHDNVGRYLQDHPNLVTATVDVRAAPRLQELLTLLYRGGKRYFPKLRLAPELQRGERVLNAVVHPTFVYEGKAVEAIRLFVRAARTRRIPPTPLRPLLDVLQGLPIMAAVAWRRYVRGRSPNFSPTRIDLRVYTEQPPDPESRVTLGDALDAFGQRRARVDWHVGELERKTYVAATRAVVAEFARLGLGTVEPLVWIDDESLPWKARIEDCYHHIGTTRIAANPEDGVVDLNLTVHGVSNLYVCSSAVFPTSGYANPTLTIVALAYRLADQLMTTVSKSNSCSLSESNYRSAGRRSFAGLPP